MININKIESDSHAGLDIIHLEDGRILVISMDCVCLYNNEQELWDATPENVPTIQL